MEIKQSLIAEAIEQDKSAPLNVYRILGHSDDVLEVNDDEFYARTSNGMIEVYFEAADGGEGIIRAYYTNHDTWVIGIGPREEGMHLPAGVYTTSVQGYTTVLTIETPHELLFSGYQGE